jgi:N-methylhydantoinase B
MNNLTFGGTIKSETGNEPDRQFAYYETIGGGAGAGQVGDGGSGIHVHMSNTRNTPVEALEYTFPLRIVQYALRHNSGGQGQYRGGDGLIRTIQFLNPATVTLVTERRTTAPYGLNGAGAGENGRNTLIRNNQPIPLPAKTTLNVQPNDQIRIETPGGGGWNKPK